MNINKAYLPLFAAIILAFGIYAGYKIQERNTARFSFLSSKTNQSKLEYILSLIDSRYVDTVDTKKLYDETLNEMLAKLDPHSVYLPPVEMKHEEEIMDGNFDGIGIEFSLQKDTIYVNTPISGGPSEKAGINAGDKIIFIDDSSAAGVKITNEMVMKRLKGPKGTKVKVGVLKAGTRKIVNYTIVRDKIPIYSVDAGFMLNKEVGYIKINRFAKTTYQEFMQKLEALQKQGMKKLVLDLRQNPGGFMDQAIEIADEFLDGNKTIVVTQGRTMPKTTDKAQNMGLFETGNLAILVDEGSASASEIVSGAIQDWDRGVIIGRRTFGKGLVQQEYEIGDGSSVRLTVAKYYTPSGRSIQSPYTEGAEAYYMDAFKRANHEAFSADSIQQNKKQVYHTLVKNRTIYGGGGITPDIFIALDTSMLNPFVQKVAETNALQEFVFNYYNNQKSALTVYKNEQNFNTGFKVDDLLYQQFVTFAQAKGANAAELKYAAVSRNYLSEKIKSYLARQLYNNEGYYYIAAQYDKMVQRAVQELMK